MSTLTGIDLLKLEDYKTLEGASVALLVNHASVDRELNHTLTHFINNPHFKLKAVFGPQHGVYGQTQDNMIEWEGFDDEKHGIPVYSLYGKTRVPEDYMLEGIDTFVIDLQDVGARYYTFLWTSFLALKKCCAKGIRVVVLDRPNPIGGRVIEGPILDPEYSSFVGLYPIPIRHGMTMGELLFMFYKELDLHGKLIVMTMKNWKRDYYFEDTALPWVFPSPNMATPDTAVVYPGFCFLEATNLSEGRGTVRPFELFGAPFIDPELLSKRMQEISGAIFRPCYFEPSFQKHHGEICGGGQLHVLDRDKFSSLYAVCKLLSATIEFWDSDFKWKEPPYEYEYKKLPIDILAGSTEFREALEARLPVEEIISSWKQDESNFAKRRQQFLFYE